MDETSGTEDFLQKAKDKTAEAKENASAVADQTAQIAQAAWQGAKNQVTDLRSLEAYVREKPTEAVLVALGVGFILGLFARR
jgi:ElaB/YqjD/DUF883 family membrane-anchored ribosome-binding protein